MKAMTPRAVSVADPVTTEVIRHALRSAAGQMKRTLLRTAFSPIIYEVVDFAVGLYDREFRLLAQAPTLALKLGTLDSCIRHAVAAVGGEDSLEDGDLILYNIPYFTGAHPQDIALIAPVFIDGVLVGYSPCKTHMVDLAGKDPYSTDTIDVHQEATIFPGVKLYRAGVRNEELWNLVLANSRAPRVVGGDLNAVVGCVRTGARALRAIIEKHGHEEFRAAVERIFDHGEAQSRAFIEQIPDGRYSTECCIDNNGRDDTPITFNLTIEVSGSELMVDLTDAPDQQPGPVNSPGPGTVSMMKLALASLAAVGEDANEGQFRPLTVKTRPSSLFEPTYPAPVFVYWAASLQLIDGFYRALAAALPEAVAAESGSDMMVFMWWGHQRMSYQRRGTQWKEPWIDGGSTPIGQGGHSGGDGSNALIHITESVLRIGPAEKWEAQNPWLVEKRELAPDSCGPGRHRGGLGVDFHLRVLAECFVTSTVERTKTPPRGLFGGGEARPNSMAIHRTDGSVTQYGKRTAILVEADSRFEAHSGGGGGYGPPGERDVQLIASDLTDGYVTAEHVRKYYPHYVFPHEPPRQEP
ncbi:MAG: hydantoinase B/oxoprolinase family protein [Thermoleophilia bacterium]|nr:hydantoinase B/oxoprolinase family protein [Thermoleophilia bacterium]